MVRIINNITGNSNQFNYQQEAEKLIEENTVNNRSFEEIYQKNIKSLKIVNNVPTGRISNINYNMPTTIGDINNNGVIDSSNYIKSTNREKKIEKMLNLLEQQIGKRYIWGTEGPNTFDCSGLVKYIYKEAMGVTLPRVSYEQAKFGKSVRKDELQPGDLVFFDTMNKNRVSHVGIYIGNNQFIHSANSRKGVIKSELKGYYADKYISAKRPQY